MTRSALALRVLGCVLVVLWFAPTIALALARLWGDRLRFHLAMGVGRTLVAVGWPGIAAKLYGSEMARAKRRTSIILGRRRP